ncbi:MAG: hypothetical protein KJ626_09840 [Verrucomicrobia bacterium]|nr:hypothetical protein [Verrucomicrobiota bacterium]
MKMRVSFACVSVLLSFSPFAFGNAVGIEGGSTYPSIQAAVNAAVDGDTILVSTGEFFEVVTVSGLSDLTINGGFNDNLVLWSGGRTAIDGMSSGNALKFINCTSNFLFNIDLVHGSDGGIGGGGCRLQSSSVEFRGVNISSNYGYLGGGMYVGAGSYALMTNSSSITSNQGQIGGGVYVEGTFVAKDEDSDISGNWGDNFGGGICVYGGAAGLVGADVMFNRNLNATGRGGGVYVQNGQLAVGDRTSINVNTGYYGGAIYATNSMVALIWDEQFPVQVANNYAGYGAGIYLDRSSLSMERVQLLFNWASHLGGGICAYKSAIWNSANVVDHVDIMNNRSRGHGGGVYLNSSTATFYNITVGTNSLPNLCRDLGGGMYATSSVVKISGGYFGYNQCTNAIWGWGAGLACRDSRLTITNGTVFTNTVFLQNQAGLTSGRGGAIYMSGGTGTSRLQGVTMLANSAVYGGGIYASSTVCEIRDVTAYDNEAIIDGGGIYSVGGSLSIRHAQVRGNHSLNNGGGICAMSSPLWIDGDYSFLPDFYQTRFDKNSCAGNGGAIYSSDSRVDIYGAHILTNSANRGGGVYVQGYGVVQPLCEIEDGIIDGNVATNRGGGIYLADVSADVEDVNIAHNDSYGDGAGIYFENQWGDLEVRARDHNTEIRSNVSSDEGGGIYYAGSDDLLIDARGTNELRFDSNVAQSGGGGAVHQFHADSTVSGAVSFVNSIAGANGGAIDLYGYSGLTLFPSSVGRPSFFGNRCAGNGGAVYGASDYTCRVENAYFWENRAGGNGGALGMNGTCLLVNRAAFLDNSATNRGGAIWAYGNKFVWIAQTNAPWYKPGSHWPLRFERNMAGGDGGSFWFEQCPDVRVWLAAVVSNEAQAAGGFYALNSTVDTRHSLYAHNSARASFAAGAQQYWGSTGFVYCCTLYNNDEVGVQDDLADLTVDHSIVWGHSFSQISSLASPTVEYNCIQDGYPGTGNFTNNPKLKSDYHLSWDSPCIEKGDFAIGVIPDIDGEQRQFQIDPGWDEFVDTDMDRLPNYVEDGGGVWVDEFRTGTSWLDSDSDDDGMKDGDEWIADVDPNDADSILGVSDIERISGFTRVTWVGGSAAHQVLEYTGAGDTNWQISVHDLPPTPKTNSWDAGNVANDLMFRVRAFR